MMRGRVALPGRPAGVRPTLSAPRFPGMSTTAIATMIAILGIVWGGFVLILLTAVVKERVKMEASTSDRAPGA